MVVGSMVFVAFIKLNAVSNRKEEMEDLVMAKAACGGRLTKIIRQLGSACRVNGRMLRESNDGDGESHKSQQTICVLSRGRGRLGVNVLISRIHSHQPNSCQVKIASGNTTSKRTNKHNTQVPIARVNT